MAARNSAANPSNAEVSTQEQNSSDLLEMDEIVETDFPIEPQVKEEAANVVLRLSENIRKGRVNIDGEDFVIDPKTGVQRKARLVRGVATIWEDEQDTVLKLSKDMINRNKRSLEFEDTVCILKPHDKAAIEFATVCNSNEDNPKRFGVKPIYFKIWNPLADAEKEEKAELDMLEAIQIASTMKAPKMFRHAVYLGIPLADEMGNKASEKAIRTLYMRKAKNNTKQFMDSVDNPEVDIAWAIKLLVNNGTIDLGKQNGQAFWKDGGYITAIPSGEDAKKYLTQFAQIAEESSRNFKAQILAFSIK